MNFHALAVAINAAPKGKPILHEEGGRLIVIPRAWPGDKTEAFFFEVIKGKWPEDFGQKQEHPGTYYSIYGINTGVGCKELYTSFKTKKEAVEYAINEALRLG